jgi:hypothetical protein
LPCREGSPSKRLWVKKIAFLETLKKYQIDKTGTFAMIDKCLVEFKRKHKCRSS